MDKLDINPDQEIIITLGDLINLFEGVSLISQDMEKVQNKLTEEENRGLLVKLMAMFVALARLFPKEQKKRLFELLRDQVGVDLTDFL